VLAGEDDDGRAGAHQHGQHHQPDRHPSPHAAPSRSAQPRPWTPKTSSFTRSTVRRTASGSPPDQFAGGSARRRGTSSPASASARSTHAGGSSSGRATPAISAK